MRLKRRARHLLVLTNWGLLPGAVGVGGLSIANRLIAGWAERRHPPAGRFIMVDGVQLHYSDRGHGTYRGAHPRQRGNRRRLEYQWGWPSSCCARIGSSSLIVRAFGYSARPRGRMWTASQQAELLYKALQQLGVEHPVVVGHSWGTLVALNLAMRHQVDIAGLVLLSGYYFWTLRPDVLLVMAGALPVLGERSAVHDFAPSRLDADAPAQVGDVLAGACTHTIPGSIFVRHRFASFSDSGNIRRRRPHDPSGSRPVQALQGFDPPCDHHCRRQRQNSLHATVRATPRKYTRERVADYQGRRAHGPPSLGKAGGAGRGKYLLKIQLCH